MGLFRRKREDSRAESGFSTPELQYPDELALEARQAMDQGQPAVAAETFAKAIDKLHTMLVVTPQGSRLRQPGATDQAILDGYIAALRACPPGSAARQETASPLAYLQEIANSAGPEAPRYREAMHEIFEASNERS